MTKRVKIKDKAYYPEHLIALCKAYSKGENCGFALVDALLEVGIPENLVDMHFRGNFVRCTPGSYCSLIASVINGWRIG